MPFFSCFENTCLVYLHISASNYSALKLGFLSFEHLLTSTCIPIELESLQEWEMCVPLYSQQAWKMGKTSIVNIQWPWGCGFIQLLVLGGTTKYLTLGQIATKFDSKLTGVGRKRRGTSWMTLVGLERKLQGIREALGEILVFFPPCCLRTLVILRFLFQKGSERPLTFFLVLPEISPLLLLSHLEILSDRIFLENLYKVMESTYICSAPILWHFFF